MNSFDQLVTRISHPTANQAELSDSCNGGQLMCCNNLVSASDPLAAGLLAALGLQVGPDVQVGLTCTSIVAGSACAQTPVCCNDVIQGGLLAAGCAPVNVNL
jgi:hypothetical protein